MKLREEWYNKTTVQQDKSYGFDDIEEEKKMQNGHQLQGKTFMNINKKIPSRNDKYIKLDVFGLNILRQTKHSLDK